MITYRFTVDSDGVRYRVRDNGALLPGRFHTRTQAKAWIDQRVDRLIRSSGPQTMMRGRTSASLLPADLWALVERWSQPEAGAKFGSDHVDYLTPQSR